MMAAAAYGRCFNRACLEVKCRRPWNGWRLSTGDRATLCEFCGLAYQEGRFCDTFHLHTPGWILCESCGKRVHCGCIASTHTYILLDAGGIECINCAGKNGRSIPLGAFSSPTPPQPNAIYPAPFTERLRDLSTKGWSQFAGAGSMQWRETPRMYSTFLPQAEPRSTMPCNVGISNGFDRYNPCEVISRSKLETKSQKKADWPMSKAEHTPKILDNGNTGITWEMSFKDDSSTLLPHASSVELDGQIAASGSHLVGTPSLQTANTYNDIRNGEIDPSREIQIQNGKGKNSLLSRYLPRTSEEELKKIAGSSEIKPLFEKTLSASDAGRIGRLVVPKRCAEAYFPPIAHPEGLPLKIQDVNGNEWVFQFRFWPNNNSRMYVLEGVAPFVQSTQLLPGDRVTFSRLEPEGKLIMGYRKACNDSLIDQDNEANKVSNNGDVGAGMNLNLSEADKSGYIAKTAACVKSPINRKRKSSNLSAKDRHLMFDSMDLYELKVTLEEAQRLLRPSSNHLSHLMIVEDDIEEYEECPIVGRPTIFTTDNIGGRFQWAQCEDCLKWRKLPVDALLPVWWTCAKNTWDLERSSCSSAQDISAEQLDDLLLSTNQSVTKKSKTKNQDVDMIEALEGLEALASLAVMGSGQVIASSGQTTTKHPRHRAGCSCIVCIQPPSGQGPKHKYNCECTVCLAVRRRFKTLSTRREKKHQEKGTSAAHRKLQGSPLMIERDQEDDPFTFDDSSAASPTLREVTGEASDDVSCGKNCASSSLKGQIDLNIQPEKEDPPISSNSDTSRFSQNDGEKCLLKLPTVSTVIEVESDDADETQAVKAEVVLVDSASKHENHLSLAEHAS